MELYWNHTSVWVFYCKFVACFQNTFSWEHLRRAASASLILIEHSLFLHKCFKTQVLSAFSRFLEILRKVQELVNVYNYSSQKNTFQGINFWQAKWIVSPSHHNGSSFINDVCYEKRTRKNTKCHSCNLKFKVRSTSLNLFFFCSQDLSSYCGSRYDYHFPHSLHCFS